MRPNVWMAESNLGSTWAWSAEHNAHTERHNIQSYIYIYIFTVFHSFLVDSLQQLRDLLFGFSLVMPACALRDRVTLITSRTSEKSFSTSGKCQCACYKGTKQALTWGGFFAFWTNNSTVCVCVTLCLIQCKERMVYLSLKLLSYQLRGRGIQL